MHHLVDWLSNIEAWYRDENRQYPALKKLITAPPGDLFLSPVSDEKSDSLAYFFDGCLMLYRHEKQLQNIDNAYSYLHFSYAKLQQLASEPTSDLDVRRWSIKKLDHIIVAMMEFCQEQGTDAWRRESETLVELHITFMLAQSDMNIQRTTNV
ncbi:hypothetical protein LRP49_05400 [Enterovibrio sp. ZSDZ35]|uniref:Transcriptional regulator n=1 Tax=Enterovibrio qingdaonensis TaxID=2899818 RepID=A0ABT5QIF5_9GAMM|nr:hypothetical protein [Enterovibrio sp. ZSDZ35]MDD1780634.1 hypothetical protein [Enterovibrio sp. ZSDZ35]